MISRRLFAKKLVTVGGSIIALTATPWGAKSAEDGAMASEEMKFSVFMDLSRYLTGFDDLDLNLGKSFYQYQEQHSNPKNWLRLLNTFHSLNSGQKNSLTIQNRLMQDEESWEIAKSIIQLWYSGWLMPEDIPSDVKADAYQKALVWRALDVSPKGVSSGQLWQTYMKN